MALVSAADGSQTAVVGTEHTLTTQTTAGVYVLEVDGSALVAGDLLELRLKTKTRAGGTSRQVYMATFMGGQIIDPNLVSLPVPTDVEIVATLKQVAGMGRAFPWNLRRIS